jgi:hypothetical protein
VVIWLPQRPPMVDFPQHAGQVALLHDIALGRSPWAREIRINLFTPYLLGYGLAWLLSMLMPVTAAIKTVLTGAYAATGLICIGIRRELGASPQLDAFYFVSFFGFAYAIGLYTFLVAAPVGLGFIWLSIRYARHAGTARGVALAALGLALLFSHGLVFLFCCGLGLGFLWLNAKGLGQTLVLSWPFAVPLLICAALFIVTRQREAAMTSDFAAKIDMGTPVLRAVFNLSDSFSLPPATWPILCTITVAALPFLGGLKLKPRRIESLLIAGGVLGILLLAPSYAWSTNWIYQRFALFLPPAYAWLFVPAAPARPGLARTISPYLGSLSIALTAFVLAQHLIHAVAFSRQTKDFDAVLAQAEPGQRALSLPLDPRGSSDADRWVYLHFPLWYQADKQGLVDFNFAALHPQIARFSNPPPAIYNDDAFAKDMQSFDWRRDDGARYRYIFVRHTSPIPATIFAGADCPPVQVAASGPWVLFEHRPCAVPANTPQAPGISTARVPSALSGEGTNWAEHHSHHN